jgi:hypothetical protein
MIARNRAATVTSSVRPGLTGMVGEAGAVRLQTQHSAAPNGNTALTFEISCTRPRFRERFRREGRLCGSFFPFYPSGRASFCR